MVRGDGGLPAAAASSFVAVNYCNTASCALAALDTSRAAQRHLSLGYKSLRVIIDHVQ